MSDENDRRAARALPAYYYRRRLGLRDILSAAGVGVGAGIAAFYLARVMLARTPLDARSPASAPARRRPGRA